MYGFAFGALDGSHCGLGIGDDVTLLMMEGEFSYCSANVGERIKFASWQRVMGFSFLLGEVMPRREGDGHAE